MSAVTGHAVAAPPEILVCLKWVDLRPEVDPLTGQVSSDRRFSGASPADRSALEWGLRLATEAGWTVTVATSGPKAANDMLRDALAVGATRAIRIVGDNTEPSQTIASRLATVADRADLICCGLYSLDRGTGSVPAFLAHSLALPQALGVVTIAPQDDRLVAERRLDHGRRERLGISGRAVVSFEAGPELRRASLSSALAARTATIELVQPGKPQRPTTASTTASGPYRPRSKVKSPPVGTTRERVGALLGTDAQSGPSHVLELEPAEAAELVVEALQTWGYIEPANPDGPSPK